MVVFAKDLQLSRKMTEKDLQVLSEPVFNQIPGIQTLCTEQLFDRMAVDSHFLISNIIENKVMISPYIFFSLSHQGM